MDKKLKIVIGIVIAIVLIMIIINIVKSNSTEENAEISETTISDIKYDEENEEYYIEDEATGEILHTASSEDELRIYTIDPDYDPKNPDEPSEYDYYEDIEKIEE